MDQPPQQPTISLEGAIASILSVVAALGAFAVRGKLRVKEMRAKVEAEASPRIEQEYLEANEKITAAWQMEVDKLRAQIDKVITGYWSEQVNAKSGKPDSGYGDKVSRAEFLVTQMCAKDFSQQMRNDAIQITGALKDGLRNQMAMVMDEMLSSLFHVKSLQDQGKVEKPY